MTRYILRRLAYSAVSLFLLSLTIFLFVRITGDPTTLLVEPGASQADIDAVRQRLGLDRSIWVQYASFMASLAQGDFGQSFYYRTPVFELYFSRLPNSLLLALAAMVFSLLIGIPSGILAAVRVGRFWDRAGKVFALLGYVGTPTGVAHLPVVTQARVPLVGMFTGAEALRVPFNRYVFHVRASYYDETEKIVEQVVSLGGKRISVFYQNDAYGEAGRKGTELALASGAGDDPAEQPVAAGIADRQLALLAEVEPLGVALDLEGAGEQAGGGLVDAHPRRTAGDRSGRRAAGAGEHAAGAIDHLADRKQRRDHRPAGGDHQGRVLESLAQGQGAARRPHRHSPRSWRALRCPTRPKDSSTS